MSDEDQIRQVIHTYFEGMYESSAPKCHAAFHPSARISGWFDGKLAEFNLKEWADFCAAIQPSPKVRQVQPRLEILSIDVRGDIASAWIIDDNVGLTFCDTLALIRTRGGWLIYNKLWHVLGPAATGLPLPSA